MRTSHLLILTFICGPVPAGSIQLSFSENGLQRDRLLTQEESTTFGPITIHSHNRADTSSANVQGSILETSVSCSSASEGVNHMSTLEFIRN